MTKRGDELETIGEVLPATLGEVTEIAKRISSIVGAEGLTPFDLERVKVPTGGGLFWTLKTPEKPNGAPVEEVSGVIIHTRLSRTFWEIPLDEKGKSKSKEENVSEQPDCYSDDGIVGKGKPGGNCDECEFAAWGSDPKGGRGQACKLSRLLFMILPDSILPRVVVVPRTSLRNVKNYLVQNGGQGILPWSMRTRLRLEKAENRNGIEFARIVPERIALLNPEQTKALQEIAEFYRPTLEQVRVERAEVEGGPE